MLSIYIVVMKNPSFSLPPHFPRRSVLHPQDVHAVFTFCDWKA